MVDFPPAVRRQWYGALRGDQQYMAGGRSQQAVSAQPIGVAAGSSMSRPGIGRVLFQVACMSVSVVAAGRQR